MNKHLNYTLRQSIGIYHQVPPPTTTAPALLKSVREASFEEDTMPCGPSMMDYPETCWKPPETGPRGFWHVSYFFY